MRNENIPPFEHEAVESRTELTMGARAIRAVKILTGITKYTEQDEQDAMNRQMRDSGPDSFTTSTP